MAAPRVYDFDKKEWVILPENEVGEGVSSGRYAFEDGIEIPVVSPGGKIGTIPSSEAQKAFQEGFRWQTQDDVRAFEQNELEAINQRVYGEGNAANAFIGGVVKGGIPGASYIMEGLGTLAGGQQGADAVIEGLDQTAQRNPIADIAGTVVGAVASPITGALAGASTRAGVALGSKVIPETASKIASLIPKTAGMALEGAYFGAHDALNESALGDPSDIAETLMAGAGSGLVFGGIAGGALSSLGAANQTFKKVISEGLDTISSGSKVAPRKVAEKFVSPSLTEEQKKLLGPLLNTPEGETFRQLLFKEGGEEAIKTARRELEALEQTARAESKALLSEFKSTVKGTPRRLQAEIDTALQSADGDFYKALDNLSARRTGEWETLKAGLTRDTSPNEFFLDLDKRTERAIKDLQQSGLPRSKARASRLENYISAEKNRILRGAGTDNLMTRVEQVATSGQELLAGDKLRKLALEGVDNLDDDVAKVLSKYADDVQSMLQGHSKYGSNFKRLDEQYSALTKTREFVSSRAGDQGLVSKLKSDPEFAHEFDVLMREFPDVAPLLQSFKRSVENPLQQQIYLNEIRDVLRSKGADTFGRLKDDDLLDLAKMVGPDDISAKIDRLRELQTTLNANVQGPISKYTNYLRALGRPVPEIFTKLEPHQKFLDVLEAGVQKGDASLVENVAQKTARSALKNLMLAGVRGTMGGMAANYLFDSPTGAIAGALAGAALRGSRSPMSTVRHLTALEEKITTSYKRLDDRISRSIDFLTGEKVRKGVIASGSMDTSLEERRKSFKARAKLLGQLSQPDQLSQHMEETIGNIEGAPNITGSLTAQQARALNFIQSKLPSDPTAHRSLFSNNTRWSPSDMELGKFERYWDAVDNPMSVLANIERGRVSPEEIETLKVVYPLIYKRLQDGVLNAIMVPEPKLSYQQRVQIGTLFQIPTDISMRPDFIASFQARFVPKENPQLGSTPSSTSPNAMPTQTEQITYS